MWKMETHPRTISTPRYRARFLLVGFYHAIMSQRTDIAPFFSTETRLVTYLSLGLLGNYHYQCVYFRSLPSFAVSLFLGGEKSYQFMRNLGFTLKSRSLKMKNIIENTCNLEFREFIFCFCSFLTYCVPKPLYKNCSNTHRRTDLRAGLHDLGA